MRPWFKTLRDLLGFNSSPICLCMVVSEQEGAEIWLNDKDLGFVTPKAIAVPRDTDVKITLKLLGHRDHTAIVRSGHSLSYYHCSLERIPLRLVQDDYQISSHL